MNGFIFVDLQIMPTINEYCFCLSACLICMMTPDLSHMLKKEWNAILNANYMDNKNI